MMSAPSAFCTAMLSSGPSLTFEPSTKERNVTPSSSSALMSLMLKAW